MEEHFRAEKDFCKQVPVEVAGPTSQPNQHCPLLAEQQAEALHQQHGCGIHSEPRILVTQKSLRLVLMSG